MKSVRIVSAKKGDQSMAFATFPSQESRDDFLASFAKAPRTIMVNQKKHDISARADKPKFLRDRNKALSTKLSDVTKAAKRGERVNIDWKQRAITVNGTVVFRQKRNSSDIEEVV